MGFKLLMLLIPDTGCGVNRQQLTHLKKSNNELDRHPTMHHHVTEMCTCVHISVTKWCIVEYGTGAMWDLCNRYYWLVDQRVNVWHHGKHHKPRWTQGAQLDYIFSAELGACRTDSWAPTCLLNMNQFFGTYICICVTKPYRVNLRWASCSRLLKTIQ